MWQTHPTISCRLKPAGYLSSAWIRTGVGSLSLGVHAEGSGLEFPEGSSMLCCGPVLLLGGSGGHWVRWGGEGWPGAYSELEVVVV
jgi:hypothetical protein